MTLSCPFCEDFPETRTVPSGYTRIVPVRNVAPFVVSRKSRATRE
jgi:hypothetical protein